MTAADVLRQAADRVEQALANTHDANLDDWRKTDRRRDMIPWASLMSPDLADPLAAWLRCEAELADNPLCAVVDGVTTPLVAWVPATAQPFALALARAILGVASPVPTSKGGLEEGEVEG